MTQDQAKTQQIIALLEQVTSLGVVQEFLKSKNLRHSAGSWPEMRDKRILPAVENNEISNLDLISLLRSAEECGRQHVFLYSCSQPQAIQLLDRSRVSTILSRRQLSHLLAEPDILLQPDVPKIVDVRWETGTVDLNLVVKEVEIRQHRKFLRNEVHGDDFYKIYTNEEQRAVNLAKLHRDGLLEVRITSHANSSKYDGDLVRFFRELNDFFPLAQFSEISLTKVKDRLWSERANLRHLIKYTDATMCNVEGNLLRAVTGSEMDDLSGDASIGQSLDLLMSQDDNAYCADANLWFRKSAHLSADIHVLLNGETHEFALPANCSEADYQYVLGQIRYFNR
jgi:hypothetical protein